ncbi:cytidylyltransferase domain-containing protein [Dysgonomonas sp. GY617]|uniref:acylneuraminate cytidylyltransferase family protein n=1 Tax=Dysgonomonas sp. GY617 TaxID=2780420 RepID=UPI0018833068|nr:acylneuraminate cytidylyltransferase family protein [Dysgonomonas sp. GY617]MBF0576529.1 acylneuraminate cytidylyltransferase family protein [Dysgonomonas sp. GY617]
MKAENITFFLPTRKGSQRVENKNTRMFAGIEGGLLEVKLRQLLKTRNIDEIILSTNDEECISIAQKYTNRDTRFKIIERPNHLCLDVTNLQDLIEYVPTITEADHILWGHVTTPIAGADEYDKAIDLYLSKLQEDVDSLISVVELKNFLLDQEGKLINNSTDLPWPRTQDLDALFEINHVMFIAKREVYEHDKNRIGKKPIIYTMDKIKSFDIDWQDDFLIAEMIYKNLF